MLTRILSILLFLTAPSLPMFAAELNEAETQALLKKMAEAKEGKPSLQVNFSEVRDLTVSTRDIVSSGILWIRQPNKFRREERGGENKTIYVSNGKTVWIYYEAFKTADKYEIGTAKAVDASLEAISSGFDLKNISSHYNVAAESDGKGWILRLTPKRNALKKTVRKLVLHVDDDFNITRSELTSSRGTFVTTYSGHRTANIPDSKFEFVAPEGTQIKAM